MNIKISPSAPSGRVEAPPSKSMMQRACAAALLHPGETIIHCPGFSADDKAALQIIRSLGAEVEEQLGGWLSVRSRFLPSGSARIHCGESGLAARLFTPVALSRVTHLEVQGSGSLLNRPMQGMRETLTHLGVNIAGSGSFLPLHMDGPLQIRNITLDGSSGSQLLTGILFAFAFGARNAVQVHVERLNSRPYIDMTLEMLGCFGKNIINEDYERFMVYPSLSKPKSPIELTIERDWSGAANWLVAAAIAGSITVTGVRKTSRQADVHIVDLLKAAGLDTVWNDDTIFLNAAPLHAFEADLTHCPDLFPIVSILAGAADGTSRLRGVHRLRHKESDRAATISAMLGGFGIDHRYDDNCLFVTGRKTFRAAAISSAGDHRIAMATAVGALRAAGTVTVLHAEAVHKSYPDFFHHLSSLGIICEKSEE